MQKQNNLKLKPITPKQTAARRVSVVILLITLLSVATLVLPVANADRYSNEISKLRSENEHSHDEVDALRIRANDLTSAIQKLQQRIDELRAQIAANEAKSNELRQQIIIAEAELARQRDILGQNIKAMYLEGQISTIEMLATSKDLSQFVDKQQYREVVRAKIKTQVDQIAELRAQLTTQREQVEKLIQEDKELREQVAAQKAEQDRLLGLNQVQQAEFNVKIKENNKKINELVSAQQALARRLSQGTFVNMGAVKRGNVIGAVGNTGFSNGAHLHLEARNSSGNVFNPHPLLNSGEWAYPVIPTRITQPYGAYSPVYLSNRHPGIDFGGAGLPVRAVADGQIIVRGCSGDSSFFNRTNAYGYVVVIKHDNGTFSVYAHMIPPGSGYGHCSYSTY